MTKQRLVSILGCLLLCGVAAECSPRSFFQDFPLIDPGTGLQAVYDDPSTPAAENFPLWVGLGSGAHRRHDDLPGVVTVLTDRGPNADYLGSKLFPQPGFVPTIYRLRVEHDRYEILRTIPILDRDGNGVNGLSNFAADVSYGPLGEVLPPDPDGFDPEAIVRLKDGSYWIGEENCPSLVHVAPGGKIIVRVVPVGVKALLSGAAYDVSEGLPAIFGKRRTNRGFESLALSHDEKSLFAIMQSPLDNPKTEARKKGNNRMIEYSLKTETTVGEWVYVEDPGTAYAPLVAGGQGDAGASQGDVKVGELVTVSPHAMVAKEAVEKATKLYLVKWKDATNILGTDWDTRSAASGAAASLEASDLVAAGITPVTKQLLFDSRTDDPELTSKIEGCAYFGAGLFLLINDNDFGILGPVPSSKTQFTRIWIEPDLLH